jgi:hypothetical protein
MFKEGWVADSVMDLEFGLLLHLDPNSRKSIDSDPGYMTIIKRLT